MKTYICYAYSTRKTLSNNTKVLLLNKPFCTYLSPDISVSQTHFVCTRLWCLTISHHRYILLSFLVLNFVVSSKWIILWFLNHMVLNLMCYFVFRPTSFVGDCHKWIVIALDFHYVITTACRLLNHKAFSTQNPRYAQCFITLEIYIYWKEKETHILTFKM